MRRPTGIRRLVWRLRYGKPCGELPPWRLIDAQPCIVGSRAALHRGPHSQDEWHADGNGFIWNQTHWHWMGPTVDLREEMAHLDNYCGKNCPVIIFTEETS